jgi:DNA modification methylase
VEQIGFDLTAPPVPLATGRSLGELEAVIERGQQTFVEVGLALLEIRDGRLYQKHHDTFEDYCHKRWGWTRRIGYSYIEAAEVAVNVLPTAQTPPSLTQAATLAPLPVEEQQAIAQEVDFSQTTVRDLQQIVRERKEATPHAVAHAERLAAYEARAAEERTEAGTTVLPYGRIAYGTDALAYLMALPERAADLCVTSPPYWAKRTYVPGDPMEVGQEQTPEQYVDSLCGVLNEIGRVLTPEGCLFLNLGDTLASQPGQYRGDPSRTGISQHAIMANGSAPADRDWGDVPEKSYCLIPERVILRLVLQDGWRLSGKIAWHKIGHQPENVFDRLTQAWEPVYVLTRSKHAYFKRGEERTDIWAIPVGRGGDAAGHLAPFPEALVERAIRHACPEGGTVLDPFSGSGTTLHVAQRMGRQFLGCDLAQQGAA